MPRKSFLPLIVLLATLMMAPLRSQAITVTIGSFWTSEFIGGVQSYVLDDTVIVNRVHFASRTWRIDLNSRTGSLNVFVDDSLNLHSVLTTDVLFSDPSLSLTDEPGVITIDTTADILGGFSIGIVVVDSNDGTTILDTTGLTSDGTLVELPVTRGSIFISP